MIKEIFFHTHWVYFIQLLHIILVKVNSGEYKLMGLALTEVLNIKI